MSFLNFQFIWYRLVARCVPSTLILRRDLNIRLRGPEYRLRYIKGAKEIRCRRIRSHHAKPLLISCFLESALVFSAIGDHLGRRDNRRVVAILHSRRRRLSLPRNKNNLFCISLHPDTRLFLLLHRDVRFTAGPVIREETAILHRGSPARIPKILGRCRLKSIRTRGHRGCIQVWLCWKTI